MNAEAIFMAAIEIDSESERSEFIRRVCGENQDLWTDVTSLIQAHFLVGTFLEQPLIDLTVVEESGRSCDSLPNRSGSSLGRYRIIRRLGSGGMGEVYLGHDVQLQRDVGIKFLNSIHTSDPGWNARFLREAMAAGAVNHPNILTVHEISQADDVQFMVTEYVEGITLRERLSARSMSLREIVDTASQIASALGAAHNAGIVHRDLKPENIMIRTDGLVKVLDFGLARHSDRTDSRASLFPYEATAAGHHVSIPGRVVGTIHYMSPEQARGLPVDIRSDFFSFGIVLYEMLSGQLPFRGDTPSDVLVAILEHEPPAIVTEEFPLPDELGAIISRLLSKDRDRRYLHTKELTTAFRHLSDTLFVKSAPESSASAVRSSEIAPVSTSSALAELRSRPTVAVLEESKDQIPEVRYTCSGEVNIAYQVFGEGEMDLVFVMGWVSHLEWFWKEPSFAAFLRRLGTFARVILFDKRGTGLSDRVPVHQLPTLEQRMDDVRAVMDAVDSQRAVLCGISEGGPMCALFAATYPEKTTALIMIGSYARRLWAVDYPWGVLDAHRQHFIEEIRRNWGGPVGIEDRAPGRALDPKFRDWWATYLRMGASPGAAVALTQMNAEIDVRPILASIQSPTLVIHRREDRCLKVAEGRFLAENIPGAQFAEFPGDDHLPFVGDQNSILNAIRDFLASVRQTPGTRRVLATVLAAKPMPRQPGDSTPHDLRERIDRYKTLAQREVELFRGTHSMISGDSLIAAFDGPTRAIRAAIAINDSARRLGLKLQSGLHTGECDVAETSVRGNAVEFARRISEIAEAHEVVVSSTIKDLVAGSGIQFFDHPALECRMGEMFSRLFGVER